ncbi:hypothetical protein ACETU7_10820 [Rhodococcus sp. 3Y1]
MMIVDEATRVVRGVADATTTVAGAVGGGVIGGVTGGIRGSAEGVETEFVRVVPRRRRRFSRWRPWVRRDWWNGRCSWQSAARPWYSTNGIARAVGRIARSRRLAARASRNR